MAFDCFLKIDGIPGESQDDKHKEWIELHSFSMGISQIVGGQRSTTGAATGGRCDHQDLSVVKNLDKTTPKLNLFCCNGTHIKKIELELCRATGDKQLYYKVTMLDNIITSIRPGGSAKGGDSLPLEEVSFNYGEINWEYTQTDHKTGKPAGKVAAKWSLVTNKGA
jgi:type VI secretion system secreted protein Hcp